MTWSWLALPSKQSCKSFHFCQVCSITVHFTCFSCLHSHVCIMWVREAVTACQSKLGIIALQYVFMSSTIRIKLTIDLFRFFSVLFQSSDWEKCISHILSHIIDTVLLSQLVKSHIIYLHPPGFSLGSISDVIPISFSHDTYCQLSN